MPDAVIAVRVASLTSTWTGAAREPASTTTAAPLRMFTLSFAFDLRRRLAFHHDDVLAVHRVVTRAIAPRYIGKARALGVKKPRTGSIGVVHRFSSDLR